MAKLHFYYSSMNAGKSTTLLQADYNYRERGMETILFTAALDNRAGKGVIKSRIGIQTKAIPFDDTDDLAEIITSKMKTEEIDCVLIDEAQFLSADQVDQLTEVVDALNIPVLAYGLRTDFLGALFEGSRQLLALADELREIKTVCHCGRKATMVVRFDGEGQPMHSGDQIQIGGNETYVSMCRRHFKESLKISSG